MTADEMKNCANMQIRTHRAEGIITAEIVFTLDGKKLRNTIRVATLNITAADLDRTIYDDFVNLLAKAMRAFMEDMAKEMPGVSFSKTLRGKPGERN